jgi:hypothetical protein
LRKKVPKERKHGGSSLTGLPVFMAQLKAVPPQSASFSGSCEVFAPKMKQEEYFRVDREWICMDGRLAGGKASCCGVNLAFVELEVLVCPQDVTSRLRVSGSCEIVPKMEQEEYLRVGREWNRVDGWLGREHSACCGVNLAFRWVGGVFFFREL